MLRKKLLIILGSLTLLLLGLAIISLWSLQLMFSDMNHIETEASKLINHANVLSVSIGTIEIELYKLQSGRKHQLDVLIDAMEELKKAADELDRHYALRETEVQPIAVSFQKHLGQFEKQIAALATAQDPDLAFRYTTSTLATAATLREDILSLTEFSQRHAREDQEAMTSRFRWMVIGIAVGFVFVINISVMFMLHAAQMILKPIDKLVYASQQLGKENFDYRVTLKSHDEFNVLGDAYNELAKQLQENETKRLDTLKQIALTLNHELNNALSIIDLQLKLLAKHHSEGDSTNKNLQRIHESLHRMATTIESVKHIRQIVLTEYNTGEKMIDLEQSVKEPIKKSSSTIR